MSVAAPPRPPVTPVRAAADPTAAAGSHRRHGTALRLAAWAGLALFASYAWSLQVAPASHAAAWGATAAGLVVAGALLLAARLPRSRRRTAALAGAAAGAVVLALATCGIELRLLRPDGWGQLAAGISQGLGALAGVRVPYRGLDEWTRDVIVLGGTLLVTLSAWVAFVPVRRGTTGRPLAAAVLLGVLYAVPVVEQVPDDPFLSGAVFTVLLAAFLWADRVRAGQARLAAGLVVCAVGVAMLVAPAVDGDGPLFDYEEFVAESLRPGNSTAFSWSHSYGPLDWPRDGREVLRVKARQGSYWKATVLPDFDGTGWVQDPDESGADRDAERSDDRSYRDELTVVVRNLRSAEYVTAGTTDEIRDSRRLTIASGFGTFRTGSRRLARGDTYRADVYVPRPSPAAMRDAGTDYPGSTRRFLAMGLPGPRPPAGEEPGTLVFPMWDENRPVLALLGRGDVKLDGDRRLAASPYSRSYALARSLRAASASPYEFIRRVRARVMRGAVYTETPPRRAVPLDAFLFDTRAGYCQQFSGAMALLLRMGGVPARVASGFTSGVFDQDRKEWVVRDLDAHSWVEAYIPGHGWVAFDPTPGASPARSQLSEQEDDEVTAADDGTAEDTTPGGFGQERLGTDPAGPGAGAGDEPTGSGGAIAGGLVLTGLVLTAAVVVLRRRRRMAGAQDPELVELVHALRRTGREPAPGTTLTEIERRLAGAPQAAAYVRAIRDARYAAPAPPPSRKVRRTRRRALRRELADGLGPVGEIRAWVALPPEPRPGRPRRRA